MSRYFITKQTVSLSCGRLTVVMTTNTTQHLWLLSTTKEPSIIARRDRRLNNTVPHQNNHTLWIETITEQEEADNTTTHTFVLEWPAGATTLWFYTINMSTASIKATRSAIYAYELQATALLGETWSNNGQPDLAWTFSDTPPDPPPPCISGKVWLYDNNFEARTAFLRLEPYLGTTPDAFCNQFLTVVVGGFTGIYPSSQLTIEIALIFRNSLAQECARNLLYTFPSPVCALNPTNTVGTAAPHATARLNFDLAYNDTTGLCHAGMDPLIPNPYPSEIRLTVAASAFAEPNREFRFDFGSLFVADSSGVLRDISKYWRSKRLSPKLP